MRTTITLDDRLFRDAKRLAVRRDSSLSAVVQDALRLYLSEVQQPRHKQHFTLVTFQGRGARPGVDLDRTSELLEADDLDQLARSR
jgi:hypothetical protein